MGLVRREWRGKWDRLIADSNRRLVAEELPFPTDAQSDLLRAAILPADEAAAAWRRWKGRGLELRTVADHASMRLFPLLFANREAAGIGPEDRALLKGVCRHTVAYNAATLSNGLRVARLLEDAGIPVMFIKGAALIAMSGRFDLRRIDDVDVLVHEADVKRAITTMLAAGYCEAKPDHRPVGFSHGRAYVSPGGQAVDLHWRALKNAGDDRGLFDTACEATVLDSIVRVSSATDSLVLTVVNAFQMWDVPALRWIADSMWILGNADIDWTLLLERARRPGVTLSLTAGLHYLAREFDAPVPPAVLSELSRRPVPWHERGAHWAVLNRPPLGALTLVELDRHRARRLHSSNGLPRDFAWHMATTTGSQRPDLLRRAPRTAMRSGALLFLIGARRLLQRPSHGRGIRSRPTLSE